MKSITCPVCRRTSYHPKDVQYRYCANCRKFLDQMPTEMEAEVRRLRVALELIKALKDGYRGGTPREYTEGRKAGYRVAGEIAEEALCTNMQGVIKRTVEDKV